MRRAFLIKTDRILVRNYSNMTHFDSDLVVGMLFEGWKKTFASCLQVGFALFVRWAKRRAMLLQGCCKVVAMLDSKQFMLSQCCYKVVASIV